MEVQAAPAAAPVVSNVGRAVAPAPSGEAGPVAAEVVAGEDVVEFAADGCSDAVAPAEAHAATAKASAAAATADNAREPNEKPPDLISSSPLARRL
jgi:hypothetical protein